ncbi:MAG: energy transducer TonB [Novosphingobium sp.]|uniref:energy transducer TonB n=1 Tax=Novosphingobium sp. TaxID=1874826 RepID=UPI0032BCF006
MRLVMAGILIGGVTVTAAPAQAQGNWTPQASPVPAPPPVYYPPPAPPPIPKPPSSTKARVAMPAENPGTWATNDDYPAESLRAGELGTTAFRLTIDTTGKVSRCDVTSSSGHSRLDETTCRLMAERGLFTPAVDAKGKPTTGSWSSRFRWVIPDNKMPVSLGAPFKRVQSFIIEADGTVSECKFTLNGVAEPVESPGNPCSHGAVFAPYTDAAGKPVRRLMVLTIEATVTDPDAPPPVVVPAAAPAPKRRKP